MKGPAAVPTNAVPCTEAVAGPDGRLQRALCALREHGLDPRTDARVRLGASLPSHPARPIPPGAEEVPFPPDLLLRPLWESSGACIVELGGAVSSGRTSLAYRAAAEATSRGGLTGWVDLPDALDPRHLRRAGVALDRVLWVRPPTPRAALRATVLRTRGDVPGAVLPLRVHLRP